MTGFSLLSKVINYCNSWGAIITKIEIKLRTYSKNKAKKIKRNNFTGSNREKSNSAILEIDNSAPKNI